MTPGTLVWLALADYRGVFYAIPGIVTRDHGPAHEYRLLVVCDGYEDVGARIAEAPGCQFVTWARLEDVSMRAEQEAA